MTPAPAPPQDVSRVARSKREARAAYDRLSRWYDGLAGSEGWYAQKTLEMASLRPGESALEIGFGTGRMLLELACQAGPGGLVAGIDLSWGMAKVARRKLAVQEVSGRALLTLGDGLALPYPARRFDLVFIAFTLELFDTPEILPVLAECRRVLRPGGRIGLVCMTSQAGFFPMAGAYAWFHRHFPAAADCRPIPARDYLQAAGFEISACLEKLMWGLPVLMLVAKRPIIWL